ncbi:MAG TPA: lipoprotein signal peptidase [Edaphocola sp.]|nr:lipoprotein signal peptidase [Edaphocola sp.]
MKYKHILLIVFLILLVDQVIKIYVKTHFYLGESVTVFHDWFQLSFIQNEGMAFGMTLMDSALGKLLLTLFRLVAVVFGFFWVRRLADKGHGRGLLVCAALILAGAAGNLIDSMFYGMIFNDPFPNEVAAFVPFGHGYAPFLHGKVVDMFYFPIIDATWPQWMPVVGGRVLRFFEPVFNLADASISIGVIVLLLFQKKFMGQQHESATLAVEEAQKTSERQV